MGMNLNETRMTLICAGHSISIMASSPLVRCVCFEWLYSVKYSFLQWITSASHKTVMLKLDRRTTIILNFKSSWFLKLTITVIGWHLVWFPSRSFDHWIAGRSRYYFHTFPPSFSTCFGSRLIDIINVFTLKSVTSTSIIFVINQTIFLRHFAASHFRISYNCAVTGRRLTGGLTKDSFWLFLHSGNSRYFIPQLLLI